MVWKNYGVEVVLHTSIPNIEGLKELWCKGCTSLTSTKY